MFGREVHLQLLENTKFDPNTDRTLIIQTMLTSNSSLEKFALPEEASSGSDN